MPSAEGSAQNPKVEGEETLKYLVPVELIKFKQVEASYQGRSYKKTVVIFYSRSAQKYYEVALRKETLAQMKASLEINEEMRTFTTERDQDKNLMWVKALSK